MRNRYKKQEFKLRMNANRRQKDDMERLYPKRMNADVWVLAPLLDECAMTGAVKVLLDRPVACHYCTVTFSASTKICPSTFKIPSIG